RLVIYDDITEEQHEMVLKPSESKPIIVDFTSEDFEEINISYWFENIGNDDEIKSDVGELKGTPGNVLVAILKDPELDSNYGEYSITITNTNPTYVSIVIEETWTLNKEIYGITDDVVYGTTAKQIDNIYGNYEY